MVTLKGKNIYLRALESEDLEFLYQLENNESVWEVSNTTAPYSKFILKQYLENSYKDIFEAKQLRLVICVSDSDKPIGCVDLFDFVPKHKRVGVGIIISSPGLILIRRAIISNAAVQDGVKKECLNLYLSLKNFWHFLV